jgi:hypothetical protein
MQTEFHVKWINVKTATGFEMTKVPFEVCAPLTARGAATFVNKNRWDVSGLLDPLGLPS